MRHRVKSKRLKRTSGELKLLLRNQACQLFEHGAITTTLSKAKILRPYAEKMVTLAKDHNFNNVKKLKALLPNNDVVRDLFTNIAPTFSKRPGGYTRIVKLGFRSGDNAPTARIEFVEDIKKKTKKVKKSEVKKEKAEADAKN